MKKKEVLQAYLNPRLLSLHLMDGDCSVTWTSSKCCFITLVTLPSPAPKSNRCAAFHVPSTPIRFWNWALESTNIDPRSKMLHGYKKKFSINKVLFKCKAVKKNMLSSYKNVHCKLFPVDKASFPWYSMGVYFPPTSWIPGKRGPTC